MKDFASTGSSLSIKSIILLAPSGAPTTAYFSTLNRDRHRDSITSTSKNAVLSLPVNPSYEVAEDIDAVIAICNRWEKQKDTLDYQIDGPLPNGVKQNVASSVLESLHGDPFQGDSHPGDE